jgi:hypothetical protein
MKYMVLVWEFLHSAPEEGRGWEGRGGKGREGLTGKNFTHLNNFTCSTTIKFGGEMGRGGKHFCTNFNFLLPKSGCTLLLIFPSIPPPPLSFVEHSVTE